MVANESSLDEYDVSNRLRSFFSARELQIVGKTSLFNSGDDNAERSFEIDFAIGPKATAGNRSALDESKDEQIFALASTSIDPVINELRNVSLFPKDQDSIMSWRWEPNPNPFFGLAVEIENNLSKYLLGSLLAAAIAGRWGILILPDAPNVPRWIETVHRMLHKGAQSPIPSNVAIFSWPTLKQKLRVFPR